MQGGKEGVGEDRDGYFVVGVGLYTILREQRRDFDRARFLLAEAFG